MERPKLKFWHTIAGFIILGAIETITWHLPSTTTKFLMLYLLNGGAGLSPAPLPGQPRAALRNAVKMLIPMGRSPAATQSASRGLLVIRSQYLLMSSMTVSIAAITAAMPVTAVVVSTLPPFSKNLGCGSWI